jgi:hypothetical protein
MIFLDRPPGLLKEYNKSLKKYGKGQMGSRKRWVTLRGRDWKDFQKPDKRVEHLIQMVL